MNQNNIVAEESLTRRQYRYQHRYTAVRSSIRRKPAIRYPSQSYRAIRQIFPDRQNKSSLNTALLIRKNRKGRIIEKDGHKSGNNEYRTFEYNKSDDCNKLSKCAEYEAECYRIRMTEPIGGCTVDSRH